MTTLYGHVWRSVTPPRSTISVACATPRETLDGSPSVLPTSEPTDAQISFTVGAGDMPVVHGPISASWYASGLIIAAGKNNDATARSVAYRLSRNGASVATSTLSMTASQYFTGYFPCTNAPLAVGDVLSLKLWCTTAGHNVSYDYYALYISPSRFMSGVMADRLAWDVYLSNRAEAGILTLGNPGKFSTYMDQVFEKDTLLWSSIPATGSQPSVDPGATHGIYRSGMDANQVSAGKISHATYRPYYISEYVHDVAYRELISRIA